MKEAPDRKRMYKVPWSVFDNQGGWVEVTDRCNLNCDGCYRSRIDGDRSYETVCEEIIECHRKTRCDVMVVAGGEPLLYPFIVDVIRFIRSRKIKPLILSNGALLTRSLALELKSAGLSRIHLHIDSRQKREGWEGKDEKELNELRGQLAGMIHDLRGIQCGFHVTVAKENVEQFPAIIEWCRANRHCVQHLSLIAFRAVNPHGGYDFFAGGKRIPARNMINLYPESEVTEITTADLFGTLIRYFPEYVPCAYINGTALPETNKYLFFVNIGSRKNSYGFLGAKSMELSQVFYHISHGTYFSFAEDPTIGKKIFALALFDRQVRSAFLNFLGMLAKDPSALFRKIYLQSMILQQPIEFMNGEKNACDHCINPMVFGDKLINPCQLDEYRIFGEPVIAIKKHTR
jgi:uncharacterized Fe-S cluster-containing radical SAM superfamily protein